MGGGHVVGRRGAAAAAGGGDGSVFEQWHNGEPVLQQQQRRGREDADVRHGPRGRVTRESVGGEGRRKRGQAEDGRGPLRVVLLSPKATYTKAFVSASSQRRKKKLSMTIVPQITPCCCKYIFSEAAARRTPHVSQG